MNFFVYLICSKNNNNRLISYVGYTNNVKRRLEKHNSSKGERSCMYPGGYLLPKHAQKNIFYFL